MNERIRELAECNERIQNFFQTGPAQQAAIEQFAKLIVQECVNEIEFQYGGGRELADGTHSPDWDDAIECVSAMVKKHFGVEE